MITLDTSSPDGAKIKVIGVGGGGGNAINSMITLGLTGVDFIAANTDKQALDHNLAQTTIQLGADKTKGLGAGADPDVGKTSVEENTEEIKEVLKGSDMVFVTAGMGGGTGTGGAPEIAQLASELDSLVVGIVTTPFKWEGKKRMITADAGIKELRKYIDALIVIPNQKLLSIIDKNTSFADAFRKVDEVLYNATRGIADIISGHGYINVDFADVKTIMKGMGDALMGIGTATGDDRAEKASHAALNSPLLDGISIAGAKGLLVNISGGSDLGMLEVAEAVEIIGEAAGENANLIHGVVQSDEPSEEISVTVVATGFNQVEEVKTEEKLTPEEANPRLPFESEKKPFRNPVQVRFPGAGKINSGQISSAAAAKRSGHEIVSSPKGVDQLKKYDRPAYERRSDPMARISNEASQMINNPLPSTNPTGEEYKPATERPAFLRKIMD